MQFDKDLDSIHKVLFLQVRQLLLKDPMVIERMKERITTYYYHDSGLCHLRTMSHGVDIGFLKGAQFDDEFDQLKGSGKKLRVLSLKKFSENVIAYYLEQAKKGNKE